MNPATSRRQASRSLPEYLPNVVGNGTPYANPRMLAALDPYARDYAEVREEKERIRLAVPRKEAAR